MKITAKQLKHIASVVTLAGIIIAALTNTYNDKNPDDPNTYGIYLGIGIAIVGIALQGNWIKKKDE